VDYFLTNTPNLILFSSPGILFITDLEMLSISYQFDNEFYLINSYLSPTSPLKVRNIKGKSPPDSSQ